MLQPGALLSPQVPICSSWLMLLKPEEELSLSRVGERASRARDSNASLRMAQHKGWGSIGMDQASIHSSHNTNPFQIGSGEGARSPQWMWGDDLPSYVSLVNRNKLITGIVSQLFMAVSYYQDAYFCYLSRSPALAMALPRVLSRSLL